MNVIAPENASKSGEDLCLERGVKLEIYSNVECYRSWERFEIWRRPLSWKVCKAWNLLERWMLSLLRTLPNLTKTFVRTLIQWENYIDCVNYPTQNGLFKGISNRFAKCIFSSASSTHASLNENNIYHMFFRNFHALT